MINRPFWMSRLERAWKEAPIVWLSGVRRAGKTTLGKTLGEERALYVNCDLPIVEQWIQDPLLFYRDCRKEIVIFDEIHQLKDPSRLLKIGADHFPHLKILATGSSTLAAQKKFKDTLTGRKRNVHLLPVLFEELESFEGVSLQKRLYHGGLPPALLSPEKSASFYREWMDSFFARDIQKLFSIRNPNNFAVFLEYLFRQSGGQWEHARASSELGINRLTLGHYLEALRITHAVHLVRPFHGHGQKELTKTPKIYAFDTGFISWARGWDPLRPDDLGILWEHVVLDHLLAKFPDQDIRYWRDTAGREIDFILPRKRDEVDVIECKWNPRSFDPTALAVFRAAYPHGKNYVVSPTPLNAFKSRVRKTDIITCNPLSIV